MSEVVDADVVERILIELDVNDLLRYKSVCKSWRSLITTPRFINRHLESSRNKDRLNTEFAHRRFILTGPYSSYYDLIGSSNGLVCIISSFPISRKCFLINPLTREVSQLELPPRRIGGLQPVCWGFGYDSSSDDYKVVVWLTGDDETCVHMFSLKSNTWKVILELELELKFYRENGILSNGALHWIVEDDDEERLIIAFDLSKDEFIEIPQPNDERYECTIGSYLGITKDRLCIFQLTEVVHFSVDYVWLMKNYNAKQPLWEPMLLHDVDDDDDDVKYDTVHYFRSPKGGSFSDPLEVWDHTNAPIFVQSLVSPHVNGRPTHAPNNNMSSKLIKDEASLMILEQMPESDANGTVKMQVSKQGFLLLYPSETY